MTCSRSDGWSSVITGDSTHLNIEGKWDETVPLEEIHEGIVEHLASKLHKLKEIYKELKMRPRESQEREDRIMRKIVSARLKYQRYMEMTRDILTRCGEFLKTRRDTPGSRIAFIRNTQEYFQQAKDFVRMDITLKKLSPSLIKYIEPKGTDTPEIYRKKRELYRTMVGILGKEKTTQFTNGIGKFFRSKYLQQCKMFNRGFPMEWVSHLPMCLRSDFEKTPEEKRWPKLLLFLFSKYCSKTYTHRGFCPECYFSVIHTDDRLGGKLYCQACGKEILWTYYLNPRSIRNLFSSFHTEEIEEMRLSIESSIRQWDDSYTDAIFDDSVDNYIQAPSAEEDNSLDEKPNENDSGDVQLKPVPKDGRGRPKLALITEQEYDVISFKTVLEKVRGIVSKLYGTEEFSETNLKYVYNMYKQELQYFEGCINDDFKYPRGFLVKIENYINYHFKLPPKERVREYPLDNRGFREGTSRKMVIRALVQLNYSSFLNHVTIICEKLWKYSRPNIVKDRDNILLECVLQKEIFKRLSDKHKRKSNINQNLVLMYIMQRHGYAWKENDFHINFHEITCEKQLKLMDEIFSIIDQK